MLNSADELRGAGQNWGCAAIQGAHAPPWPHSQIKMVSSSKRPASAGWRSSCLSPAGRRKQPALLPRCHTDFWTGSQNPIGTHTGNWGERGPMSETGTHPAHREEDQWIFPPWRGNEYLWLLQRTTSSKISHHSPAQTYSFLTCELWFKGYSFFKKYFRYRLLLQKCWSHKAYFLKWIFYMKSRSSHFCWFFF